MTYSYVWDALAGAVDEGSRTALNSHQSSYVTVGPRAHVSDQRGCRSGGRTLPGLRGQCLGLARRQRSILARPQPHGHPGRYQTLLFLPCQSRLEIWFLLTQDLTSRQWEWRPKSIFGGDSFYRRSAQVSRPRAESSGSLFRALNDPYKLTPSATPDTQLDY